MPQDFKKRGRGRRGGEKEKKEKILDQLRARAEGGEEVQERPTKRQRLSPQLAEDQVVLDQPDYQEHGEHYGRQQTYEVYDNANDQADYAERPESQFFGHLDDAEQAFLKQIDLILANSSYESPDEKPLFLENAWKEVSGKEMKVACSQSCSRVLERLIKASGKSQLKGAWSRMQGNFLALVQHRFASHVVEALLIACAPAVSEELLGEEEKESKEEKNEYEDHDTQALKKSMESYYLDTIQELENDLGYLMTDQFASHTLRTLLLALSGRPLAGTAAVGILQSKKKERILLKEETDKSVYNQRVVPDSFTDAVGKMVSGTLAGLDTNYVRALATNPLANPVLQLFLELEFQVAGKQKAKDDKSLYRRLLPDDPPNEGTQSASFIKGLLFDPIGSRLLETIIRCAPGKTFKVIYKSLFKDNLANMVKNEVAGYVVIKILERLGQEELQSALEQILPQILTLIERSRHSVIKTMIERCRVRGVSTDTIAQSLVDALGSPGPEFLSKLLQLDALGQGDMSAERRAQMEQQNSSKVHASTLAQCMLASPDSLQKVILDSLVGCDSEFLAKLGKDRTGTHVLQAALDPKLIDKHTRRQTVQKLTAVIMDLALDRVGSHVVDALVNGTTGLQFLREAIAEDLLRNESRIRESGTRAVWKNWNMNLYQWKRGDWNARMKEQAGEAVAADSSSSRQKPAPHETGMTRTWNARQAPGAGGKFNKFNSGGAGAAAGGAGEAQAKPKTGIEAARARFASQQRRGGGGGRGGGRGGGARQTQTQNVGTVAS